MKTEKTCVRKYPKKYDPSTAPFSLLVQKEQEINIERERHR